MINEKPESFTYEILESGAIYVSESEMQKSIRQEDLEHLKDFFNSHVKKGED